MVLGLALPPDFLGLLVVGDVGEDRAGALFDARDRTRVGALVGVLGDTEDTVLRVEGVELAVVTDPDPGDVVAVEADLVAVAESVRGEGHREVGLAGGRREAADDVELLTGLLVLDAQQQELLGEELAGGAAVVAGLAQTVGDLAQQRVAAVGGAEVKDRTLVGDRREETLVLVGALAEVGQVAGHVHRTDEGAGVLEVVDVVDADARHPDHLLHDRAAVGELDTGGVGLQRRAGGSHQVGNDVHRLALGGAGHALGERRDGLLGGLPVVVDALVLRVGGGDHGALLGARGVLAVGTAVVAATLDREELTGLQGLLKEPLVVDRADYLDALGTGHPCPVGHVLAHMRIRQPRLIEDLLNVNHSDTLQKFRRLQARYRT